MQSPTPSPSPSGPPLEAATVPPDAPYMDLLTSLHDQISAFLLFSAVVQVVVIFALGALVLGVLTRRG